LAVVIANLKKKRKQMKRNNLDSIAIFFMCIIIGVMAVMITTREREIKALEYRIVNPTMPTSEPPRSE